MPEISYCVHCTRPENRGMRHLFAGTAPFLRSIFFFSLVFAAASLSAQEPRLKLLVSQDGSGPHRSIQSAIAAADAGALIEIRPGTYQETLSIEKPVKL